MSTSSRFLRLLSLLQTHRYWSGDELAQRLDVSLRTVRRDIERLRELGYPVQAGRGVGGGYELAPGAVLPPLVLDDEEAVALVVALQSTVYGGSASLAEAALRALGKIIPVFPSRLRSRARVLTSATVGLDSVNSPQDQADPGLLVTFAQACRDRERLAFDYLDARGAATSRTVEPASLVAVGHRYYLVAYDLHREAWRSFRADRASNATPRGLRFVPRAIPGQDAAAFVRQGLRRSGGQKISARVHASERRVSAMIGGWFTVTHIDEHSCQVSGFGADPHWATFALANLGAELSDVQPAELRTTMREVAARLAAAAD